MTLSSLGTCEERGSLWRKVWQVVQSACSIWLASSRPSSTIFGQSDSMGIEVREYEIRSMGVGVCQWKYWNGGTGTGVWDREYMGMGVYKAVLEWRDATIY